MKEKTTTEDETSLFDDWIDENYKKFTSIGIFGGLSVYLTQIPIETSLPIQAGIAGSLLIFIILTLTILFDGVDRCLSLASNSNPDFFIFMLIVSGLAGILVAVGAILGKYSEGATPLIDAASTIGIFIYYMSYFFLNSPFKEIERDNRYRLGMVHSPTIAVVWMVITILYQSIRGEPTMLATVSWDPHVVGVLTLSVTHFLLTLLVFGSLVLLEAVAKGAPHVYRRIRKY